MNPYLSVVMGVGGVVTEDLLDRLHASLLNIGNLTPGVIRMGIEIIIVEWNIQNAVDYSEVIPIFNFETRIIHTRDSHSRYPNPHGFKYFEMPPKNIGIRRAHGEFVLSTNPDDIWSEDLAAFLARRELQHGHFYRVNRHDTRNGDVFRVCWASGAFPVDTPEKVIAAGLPRALPLSENPIHYNASGDFTLMSKEDWFKIRGNPERDYNHTVDGQTLFLASQMGMKQIVLPYPIYHPDHARTLNVGGSGQFVGPEWDDHFPFTKQNDENWGFAGMEFPETML